MMEIIFVVLTLALIYVAICWHVERQERKYYQFQENRYWQMLMRSWERESKRNEQDPADWWKQC